jgi:DNA-binding CsgD family transcriptional regulator
MTQKVHPSPDLAGALVAALDGLCVGIVMMTPAGKVTWTNRVAQHVLGIDPRQDHGKPLARLLHDPQIAAFWHEAVRSEQTLLGSVSVHEPVAAELKLNATPSFDDDGGLVGRALIFCDVTKERTVQVSLSEEATRRLLNLTDRWNDNGESHEGLTQAEVRILRCVGGGQSNPQIAQHLHISPATVRSHLKHVYKKIEVGSRSEAISYAIRHGLVGDN